MSTISASASVRRAVIQAAGGPIVVLDRFAAVEEIAKAAPGAALAVLPSGDGRWWAVVSLRGDNGPAFLRARGDALALARWALPAQRETF